MLNSCTLGHFPFKTLENTMIHEPQDWRFKEQVRGLVVLETQRGEIIVRAGSELSSLSSAG